MQYVHAQVGRPLKTPCILKAINVNFQNTSDILLQQQLEKTWTTDIDDRNRDDSKSMSVEDKCVMKTMETSVTFENGHYQLGLPWRDKSTCLPISMALALARLQQLRRKLLCDSALHQKYAETVNDYIAIGYAREVTHIDSKSKRVWYLPHHPVINPNKPGKLRVVFDCAAKFQSK